MKRATLIILAALAASACSKTEDTPSEPQAPAVPAGLALHSATTTSLSFQWNAVEGAESYDWQLSGSGSVVDEGSSSNRNAIINNLESGTTYSFKVRSVASGLTSDWCAALEASTKSDESGNKDPEPEPDPIGDADEVLKQMNLPAAEEDGVARAFPGAEGGAMYVTGGRGGKVYHVTNLKDSGEGSLRWAVQQKGARTIVFDVAGTIELSSRLDIKNGDLTIAGQTAPGDGICLKNYTTYVGADNVIIRFLRFRVGDEGPNAGDSDDAIWGRYQKDIIIDHCSMSWSIDECASFYANRNFTLQWCVITESMRNCSKHSKGSHGYGGIWGGDNASFHHNLLSNHDSRNPRFDHDYVSVSGGENIKGPNHFINNVIYNWGGNSAYGGESGSGSPARQINMVANYYKAGPNSSNRYRIVNPTTKCSNCNSSDKTDIVPGLFWITDNFMYGSEGVTADNWTGVEPDDKNRLDECKAQAYQGTHKGTLHSAEGALEAVTAWAGASLSRDAVDKRACGQVAKNTGALIDDIADVASKYGSSWPNYKASEDELARTADTDGDGIPDYYEDLFGLDKNSAADGPAYTIDATLKRYTNLELYLHYLVREVIAGQAEGGQYTTLQ